MDVLPLTGALGAGIRSVDLRADDLDHEAIHHTLPEIDADRPCFDPAKRLPGPAEAAPA